MYRTGEGVHVLRSSPLSVVGAGMGESGTFDRMKARYPSPSEASIAYIDPVEWEILVGNRNDDGRLS